MAAGETTGGAPLDCCEAVVAVSIDRITLLHYCLYGQRCRIGGVVLEEFFDDSVLGA